MHDRLASALQFPSYYGKNWDAFWDCVTTMGDHPEKLKVRGVHHLDGTLPREAALLRSTMADFEETPEGSQVTVIFE
jgi:RNAse (barnase) inhibitor barstar